MPAGLLATSPPSYLSCLHSCPRRAAGWVPGLVNSLPSLGSKPPTWPTEGSCGKERGGTASPGPAASSTPPLWARGLSPTSVWPPHLAHSFPVGVMFAPKRG